MNVPDDRSSHRSRLRVRYAETDRMGVAYYANYLVWFEVARTDFLRAQGLRYRDLEQRGYLLPVGSASMRMLHPARYDDALAVDCWLDEVRSRQVTFGYRIVKLDEPGHVPAGDASGSASDAAAADAHTEDTPAHGAAREVLIATGRTTLVSADVDLRPRRLAEDVLTRFKKLCPRSNVPRA